MQAKKKAVALKYNSDLPAPIVVAKGQGELANKIEQIAKECGIQIVWDKELVEKLSIIEIGDFIPEELYAIIAEILVFALRLRK